MRRGETGKSHAITYLTISYPLASSVGQTHIEISLIRKITASIRDDTDDDDLQIVNEAAEKD